MTSQPPQSVNASPAEKVSEPIARPRHVRLRRKYIERYRAVAGDEVIDECHDLARKLRGVKLLELSSTATGGGVAELLSSLVPLECDAGLNAQWQVIAGDGRFFEVTKLMHNGLQGMPVSLSSDQTDEYLRHNEMAAKLIANSWDIVVVHDPQPAAVRSFMPEDEATWLWCCHVDSSNACPEVWSFLREYVGMHDWATFTLSEFVPPDIGIPVSMLVPAIDPLTSKNRALPAYLARETVADLGIDVARPLMLQVSRFDPWKDPFGVVDAWRIARNDIHGLQLAMVGSMASDDPEGWRLYEQIEAEMGDDRDSFLFTDQMGVAGYEVNALQHVADVVIQKSIREGFGLVISEALWKGAAIVAGGVGGIPLQLEHGVSGFLANTTDDFAARAVELLERPDLAREFGAAGVRAVRKQFLMPRLLRDRLRLIDELLN